MGSILHRRNEQASPAKLTLLPNLHLLKKRM
jgi:hypothetical protein